MGSRYLKFLGLVSVSLVIALSTISGQARPKKIGDVEMRGPNETLRFTAGGHIFGFRPGEVVDPVLSWNTFLGGTSTDEGLGIAVDSTGNVYVTGWSWGTWGSPVRPFGGNRDAFVAKLDGSGALLWNTFLGGISSDYGRSLAVDTSGNVYVTGLSGWPWGSPVRPHTLLDDAFAAKLDGSGALLWNTFLGGSDHDDGLSIAVHTSGNIYVAGSSNATWGSPVRPFAGGGIDDAFAAKLDGSGALLWNTFLGGTGADNGSGLAVDTSGNVFVTGQSDATWGSPVRSYSGWWDGFAAKLDGSGALLWNTFFGASDGDWSRGIAVDTSGNSYMAGSSRVTWGSPVQPFIGSGKNEAFAVKLDASGALLWNTFLGGLDDDNAYGIAVDPSRNIYVAGTSRATWGSPVRPYTGSYDAFAAQLNEGGALQWNAFLGTPAWDDAWAIAVDTSGNAYVGGTAPATWGSPIRPFAAAQDAFAAKIFGGDRKDLVGSWDGQGVYSRDSISGLWTILATSADMIACGDLYGDGKDDLIGIWASQAGVWTRNSANGSWAFLSSTARHIASGDMNGDGRADFLGTWDGQGVYYRDSITGTWMQQATPADLITAGDLDGDGKDDLIGIWPSQAGVWAKYSQAGNWDYLGSSVRDLATGDMNGDGRADLLGTWDGQGVYYRDSISGAWVQVASPADQIAAGDLDGDGKDDLIGIWAGQAGVWVKSSQSQIWSYIGSSARDIATGKMAGGTWSAGLRMLLGLELPMGGYPEGPGGSDSIDLSSEGPGGKNFSSQVEPNLAPPQSLRLDKHVSGPGEPGFQCVQQENLFPGTKTPGEKIFYF
jgi:hypothetical protein